MLTSCSPFVCRVRPDSLTLCISAACSGRNFFSASKSPLVHFEDSLPFPILLQLELTVSSGYTQLIVRRVKGLLPPWEVLSVFSFRKPELPILFPRGTLVKLASLALPSLGWFFLSKGPRDIVNGRLAGAKPTFYFDEKSP